MPALRHRHAYKKVKRRHSEGYYFMCTHPECTHWAIQENMQGKMALCGECKEEFIMKGHVFRKKLLTCPKCNGKQTPQEVINADALDDLMENLG